MGIILDVSQWGTFNVDELFSPEKNDARLHDNKIVVPQISAASGNNGINSFVETEIYWDGNAITVSCNGTTGGCDAFYQEEPFATTGDTIVWRNQNINKYNALFVCQIVALEKLKYSYGRKCNKDRQKALMIRLPQTASKEPDWDGMTDYIKNLSTPTTNKMNNIIASTCGDNNVIKVLVDKHIDFDEFQDWANVRGQYQSKQHPTGSWKTFTLRELFGSPIRGIRIKKADRIIGDIPFITAGEYNNGAAELIDNEEATIYSNALTIDMFGNCFYHSDEFKCDDNILVLMNKNLNPFNGLFIASVLMADKYKHDYGRQYRQKDYMKHHIKLPVTSDGHPDWQFMEDYIKSLPYSYRLGNATLPNNKETTGSRQVSLIPSENACNCYALMVSNLPSALQNLTPEQMTNALIYAGEQACGEQLDNKYHTMVYNWMNALHQAMLVSTIGIGTMIAADPELQARINNSQNWINSIQIIKAKIIDKKIKKAEVEATITTIVEDDLASPIVRGYDKYSVNHNHKET